jgi:hypothetical protein
MKVTLRNAREFLCEAEINIDMHENLVLNYLNACIDQKALEASDAGG